mmetsp:Transcript_69679/g.197464  ORF Transcript_69679/g.197464 Transcript_69679/m.197464 type:complete len:225 (+) Transcript_69679:227-901(+)
MEPQTMELRIARAQMDVVGLIYIPQVRQHLQPVLDAELSCFATFFALELQFTEEVLPVVILPIFRLFPLLKARLDVLSVANDRLFVANDRCVVRVGAEDAQCLTCFASQQDFVRLLRIPPRLGVHLHEKDLCRKIKQFFGEILDIHLCDDLHYGDTRRIHVEGSRNHVFALLPHLWGHILPSPNLFDFLSENLLCCLLHQPIVDQIQILLLRVDHDVLWFNVAV